MHRITATAALALTAGMAYAGGVTSEGPDVICGVLTDTLSHGKIGDYRAYSIGTTSCNKGNERADWIQDSLFHPVISTALYKYEDGRLIMLGASFVKHSFAVASGNACGFGCTDSGFTWLGPGCSDPYGASLNASQGRLGPRFEVNAFTGGYQDPPSFDGQGGNAIYKRLQVLDDDIAPGSNYYAEGAYVTLDDAQAGNQFNNASYAPARITSSLGLQITGNTQAEIPAVFAWQAEDPSVTISQVDVPGEGRFYLASKSVDNGDGTWRYEYGLYNLNSHQSAGSMSVPMNTVASNLGFNDIHYHSGDPYSGTDWSNSSDGSNLTFSTQTFAENQNANAVRWGTMYNFWFDTTTAPTTGDVEIGLFRPGATSSVTGAAVIPSLEDLSCPADLAAPFGVLNFFDLGAFLTAFNEQRPEADLAAPFGTWNFFDLGEYLNLFNQGCP